MQAAAAIDRIRDHLNDDGTRWGDAQLRRLLDDGVRYLAEHRPEAVYQRAAVALAQGAQQTLPSDGVRLLRARRYMGTDGSTPGDRVTEVAAEVMDRWAPGWRGERERDKPRHVVRDEARDHYEVYPPNTGNGHLEIDYSYIPAALSDGDALPVDDEWVTGLVHYATHRAFLNDAEFGLDGVADSHFRLALTAWGMGDAAQ
jgi:hypothetical protein